ncbi:putative spermidine/putrescine transport system ATP-binding protein [Rhizobium azooxidifex]|uniref:Putative spermidine/putrescine transport system ATP-binding protein n=1 Tax=Mycoplana azooxidifex TaxID=1636188 RepID=A0A7W6D7B3_9HYPH|nr:ABC transporter ATP-binding protein [Mycoplana azooxidifex]MBB3975447.1 putative spermidine/putrescine transport system ATP-binding protein [Mycoplana azooxidifex]
MTTAVLFDKVSRHFGSVRAVDSVDLAVVEGEFFAMLGPSGSGKTTCLRLMAGFEQPTGGHIEIFGETAEGVPPYRRNVNTVFQDYALFPHLSILENVAYGLMVKGVGKEERLKAAEDALAMVKLPGYGTRRPGQLSGGQRQRVALARALVNRPRVLLLDEPLGALDLKLREQMQEELKTLQKSLGITFVFVTHDQGEALSMADRVAVFNDGRIQQLGTPEEVYKRPQTRFVADFVGSSNVLSPAFVKSLGYPARYASLRPEALSLGGGTGDVTGERKRVTGTVVATSFLGAANRVTVEAGGGTRIAAMVPASEALPEQGSGVTLSFAAHDLHLMDEAA